MCCLLRAASSLNWYHLTKSKLACVGFVRVMFICLPYAQIALLTCVLAHEFLAAYSVLHPMKDGVPGGGSSRFFAAAAPGSGLMCHCDPQATGVVGRRGHAGVCFPLKSRNIPSSPVCREKRGCVL